MEVIKQSLSFEKDLKIFPQNNSGTPAARRICRMNKRLFLCDDLELACHESATDDKIAHQIAQHGQYP